jgi:hypothetical protein
VASRQPNTSLETQIANAVIYYVHTKMQIFIRTNSISSCGSSCCLFFAFGSIHKEVGIYIYIGLARRNLKRETFIAFLQSLMEKLLVLLFICSNSVNFRRLFGKNGASSILRYSSLLASFVRACRFAAGSHSRRDSTG